MGRTKISGNNNVYCQLDMQVNMVNKASIISLKGNIWRANHKLSMIFLTFYNLKTILVGITDLFNNYFKSYN